LLFEKGKRDEMFGKLQIKPGKTKEELATIISGLYSFPLQRENKQRSKYARLIMKGTHHYFPQATC
jgi:hypothetical protein